MNWDKRNILFGINSIANLLVYLTICISVGFSESWMIRINGIFLIVYILSLWSTSSDTLELYDKKYYIIDMLSIAIYSNMPRLFIVNMSNNQFFVWFWSLLGLNEIVCIVWDFISHNKAINNNAKRFHITWTILTFLGILIMCVTISKVYYERNLECLVIFNTINVVYQVVLLIAWWTWKYYIEQKSVEKTDNKGDKME